MVRFNAIFVVWKPGHLFQESTKHYLWIWTNFFLTRLIVKMKLNSIIILNNNDIASQIFKVNLRICLLNQLK